MIRLLSALTLSAFLVWTACGVAHADSGSPGSELKKLEQQASSPADLIARKAAWLAPVAAAESVTLARAVAAAKNSKPSKTAADETETDEARDALADCQAQAATPQQRVAVTEEFFRLNKWLVPRPTASKMQRPVDNRSANFDAITALYEVKASARTPEEMVALTQAFFRLNPSLVNTR